MQLYLLKPIKPWGVWYDKVFGFVIRAENEEKARELASNNAGDEEKEVWLNPDKTSCKPLSNEGKTEVILRDFASA